jgi:hypothetical protein
MDLESRDMWSCHGEEPFASGAVVTLENFFGTKGQNIFPPIDVTFTISISFSNPSDSNVYSAKVYDIKFSDVSAVLNHHQASSYATEAPPGAA